MADHACSLRQWSALGILVILSIWCNASYGSSIGYDASADWISGIAAQGNGSCQVAQPPQNTSLPSCPKVNLSSAEQDRLFRMGHKFAPVVFMHQDDWSYLMDPGPWINNATLFNTLEGYATSKLQDEENIQTFTNPDSGSVVGSFYFGSWLWRNNSFNNITTEDIWANGAGDSIDPRTNRSTAKVYYTAFMMGGAVVYVYHYYYPFNGCSNQLLGTNLQGKYQGIEYYMCPSGTHEGDWEHIKVYVCAGDVDVEQSEAHSVVGAVQYSAHSWFYTTICNVDNCTFVPDDDGNLRVGAYSGLFSHANYPWATPLVFYEKVYVRFLANMDGVYIGDRTNGSGPIFMPDENNTLYLPPKSSMSPEDQAGKWLWAVYAGSWGGYYTDSYARHNLTLVCFEDKLSSEGPCNEQNPAAYWLARAINITGTAQSNMSGMVWTNQFRGSTADPQRIGLTGPLYRSYSYMWGSDTVVAPLYTSALSGGDLSCPFSGDPTQAGGSGVEMDQPSALGFILGLLGLLVGTGVLLGILMCMPWLYRPGQEPLRKLAKYGDAALGQPLVLAAPAPAAQPYGAAAFPTSDATMQHPAGREGSAALLLPDPEEEVRSMELDHTGYALWLGVGTACYVTGVVLSVIGIRDAFRALGRVYSTPVWGQLEDGLVAIVVLFGIFEGLTILLSFVRGLGQSRLFCLPIHTTCMTRCWRGMNTTSWIMSSVVACLLLIEINVTMGLFAFGVFISLIKLIAELACIEVIGIALATPARDLCLDLNPVGIDKIICGEDLTQVCNIWADLQPYYTCYGCFLFLTAHIMYLLVITVNCVDVRRMNMLMEKGYKQQRPAGTTTPTPSCCSSMCFWRRGKKTANNSAKSTQV